MTDNTEASYLKETSGSVAKVLSRLQGVEKIACGYYKAPCPSCNDGDDHRLSIVEGHDGRAIPECEKGGWLWQTLEALDLKLDDLFQCADDVMLGDWSPAYPEPEGWIRHVI